MKSSNESVAAGSYVTRLSVHNGIKAGVSAGVT